LRFTAEDPDKLDRQTLRSVRELTASSAAMLDRLLPDMVPVQLAE
jgi:hypothetical protein